MFLTSMSTNSRLPLCLVNPLSEMTTKTDKEIANEALEEAIAICKTKGLRLWKELGVTRGAVWQWKLDDREIPGHHCRKILALTDGQISCERLNPKIFGAPSSAMPSS